MRTRFGRQELRPRQGRAGRTPPSVPHRSTAPEYSERPPPSAVLARSSTPSPSMSPTRAARPAMKISDAGSRVPGPISGQTSRPLATTVAPRGPVSATWTKRSMRPSASTSPAGPMGRRSPRSYPASPPVPDPDDRPPRRCVGSPRGPNVRPIEPVRGAGCPDLGERPRGCPRVAAARPARTADLRSAVADARQGTL